MRCRVAVEVDGGVHRFRSEADAQRASELAKYGIRVLRFTNEQVGGQLKEVIARIKQACDEAQQDRL